MTDEECKYEELELTKEQRDEAWDYISGMQSDIEDNSSGKQLRELFKEKDLVIGQKIYIAYIFGRTEERYRELRDIEYDIQ
jgi:hypothetical protein